FDKGYAHEYFITNLEKNEAIIELPYLLITDKPITTLEPLSKLLQELHTRHASLVIIAPSFSTEALSVLLQNKLSGALSNLAINAPSFGENQREILEDIAILTGATFISDAAGYKFEDLTTKQLGKCDYITSSDKSTLIVGGKADVTERVAAIKHKLEEEEDDFKSEKLKERLAKLTNGIAVIHVGGYTEIEMKERKERIDDAVHATQAAMKKGIIAGGETIYLLLREELGNSLPETLLYKALEKPFNKLVENAGFDSGVMRERWANSLLKNKGVDVRDGKVKDMVKTGIIDPLLVVSSALYNSISVAISLLLTEAIITPERQVK
ncbi:MAG TPA: TCP-1/cpn60 chaperonin family protein, partial [Patescibacteria group bacterium]